jgi:hypothetical protein
MLARWFENKSRRNLALSFVFIMAKGKKNIYVDGKKRKSSSRNSVKRKPYP